MAIPKARPNGTIPTSATKTSISSGHQTPPRRPQRTTATASTPPQPPQKSRRNRFATPPKVKGAPKQVKRQVITQRTRDPNSGLAQEVHTTYEAPKEFAPRGSGTSTRRPSLFGNQPEAHGIGLLQAEFFGCLIILIFLLLSGGNKDLPTKIMNTVKRGTLLCVAFFFLALIAGIGENSRKIATAFGALLFVALLMTSPVFGIDSSGNVTGVLKDLDNIIKNEWAPTAVHSTVSTSAVTTPTPTSGNQLLSSTTTSPVAGGTMTSIGPVASGGESESG